MSALAGQRVLVTGAGGFIGSHLCERLVRDGAHVRAFCRYTSRRELGLLAHVDEQVRHELELRFGDLADADFMARAVAGSDVVLHLGASISVPYSFEAPREVVRTNVEGTLAVLTAARDSGVRRVVQMSSSEVYGSALRVPMDEDHPLGVQSPYAASKVAADKLAESFHAAFGVPAVVARPFNTFGPRQSLRAVIPTIVAQALVRDEVRLGATSPRRDYVFVEDTVDALVLLASSSEHAGSTFNLSTGVDVSIGGIVEMVSDLLGRPLRVVSEEARLRPGHSEVARLVGDGRRMREAFGWEPATPFEHGLRTVVEWMGRAQAPAPPDVYVT
ncbi:MAG: SDR family NAD(P)-dependent oxidoreductase [Solirubrobacteraceae bacterium]